MNIRDLAALPADQWPKFIDKLSAKELVDLEYAWEFHSRENQRPPPGDWYTWAYIAGRASGKTRAASEFIIDRVKSGAARRIHLVGRTAADVRDVMIEGESGILTRSHPSIRPIYTPSKRLLTWPNGAIALTFSAEEPNQLRGPQCDTAWCDEIAAWDDWEAWAQLTLGARLGNDPRIVVTTTPRPVEPLIRLLADPSTVQTRGSTYDNRANIAGRFLKQVERLYAGTRFGRQELYGDMLESVDGALWTRDDIERCRIKSFTDDYARVVVAVDPAMSAKEGSDETGIVVNATDYAGNGYVLADRSGKYHPDEWARVVVDLYREYNADRVIAEVNQGGALVEQNVRTVEPNISFKAVRATHGKRTRAEPIAALYQQGKVSHVGYFEKLERQMCTWNPYTAKDSPDRVDANVWGLTELMIGRNNVPTSYDHTDYDYE